MEYKKLTVEYMLDKREVEALEELKEHWQQYTSEDGGKPFAGWTLEKVFQVIMEVGCKYDISRRIKEDQFKKNLITVEELCNRDFFKTKSERQHAGESN